MPETWSIGKDFVEEHKRIFLRTILDIPLTCIPPTWCFWTKMVEIYVFHFSAENHLIEKSVRKLKNRSKCCSYFCCSNANLCWSSLSILFNNRLCGVAWPGDKKVDIPLNFEDKSIFIRILATRAGFAFRRGPCGWNSN